MFPPQCVCVRFIFHRCKADGTCLACVPRLSPAAPLPARPFRSGARPCFRRPKRRGICACSGFAYFSAGPRASLLPFRSAPHGVAGVPAVSGGASGWPPSRYPGRPAVRPRRSFPGASARAAARPAAAAFPACGIERRNAAPARFLRLLYHLFLPVTTGRQTGPRRRVFAVFPGRAGARFTRKRVLRPTELLGQMQKGFKFPARQETNGPLEGARPAAGGSAYKSPAAKTTGCAACPECCRPCLPPPKTCFFAACRGAP